MLGVEKTSVKAVGKWSGDDADNFLIFILSHILSPLEHHTWLVEYNKSVLVKLLIRWILNVIRLMQWKSSLQEPFQY